MKRFQDYIADTSKKVKPTRYYPNGAYMDEPEIDTKYWYIGNDGEFWYTGYYEGSNIEGFFLESQNLFPTEEASQKELKRKKLTAKMYRDMREDCINGEWDGVAGFSPYICENCGEIEYLIEFSNVYPHNFKYKETTFIKDLKALGWTKEKLKIVWFNIWKS